MIPFRITKFSHPILNASLPRVAAFFFAAIFFSFPTFADEPYARSRDYDLQHSKIALKFDVEQKKVIGDVTHSLCILREGIAKLAFDSEKLTIQSVTVNKAPAKFETPENKLVIALPAPAHAGDKFEVEIRYEGKPSKGLYFILPDKDYPERPVQIWTQGESEDTRAYLPTYDYPNDRLTTETILTVPASWITVANGKLISVTEAGKGLKTWTWKELLPSSTYLITVVAGDFEEVKDSWRGIPVTYYAPKGRGDRLRINYGRTPEMLELFSRKFGVDYPWEKYAQSMVDDFVAGGMENSSATTNMSLSLRHPALVPEYVSNEDDLISHELTHQWFGDLVTCKDWGNIWLNEGFATFGETLWTESHFGRDLASFELWDRSRSWFTDAPLYTQPIVRHDFDDSSEFDDNAYNKGGWVLSMLRAQLGDDAFFHGLKHYLEANRGKNVVTADFARAMEEATHTNIDEFLQQWIYGAGAPRFDVGYVYDDAKHQITLTVKQTQKVEGRVGIFRVPMDVEITTSSGPRLYHVTIAKETETFTLPADAAPLMVIFDKGLHVLKSVEFRKDKKEWLYQLKNAADVPDRADAVVALGKLKNDDDAVAALGDALRNDKFRGIRSLAASTLGTIASAAAKKELLEALKKQDEPVVRASTADALGYFKNDAAIVAKLDALAREDSSYRTRAAALQALGRVKAPAAYATLTAAVAADSPDGFLRNAALRSLGALGDDKAAPLLLEWSAPGHRTDSRNAAIYSVARLDKENKEITRAIASYLDDKHFSVRTAAINALGIRGDASAIPALEAQLSAADLSIELAPMIKQQIERLKKGGRGAAHPEEGEKASTAAEQDAVNQRLERLEQLVREMNERLKAMDARLPPPPKN